ncbi:MAG TPA: choice-of-anchor tandem repeat NxxGxxAF-containing protein [Methylomirabilota bacterium]
MRPLLGLLLVTVATVAADTPARILRVVATGDAAPGGGVFDRFGAEAMPIVAPVNAKGDVVFFATLGRAGTDEGFFRWSRGRINPVAREGDSVPGAGRLSGFGKHPAPGLSDDGTVVFAAAIAGGRAVEGIFAAHGARLRPVALSGSPAPGASGSVLAGVDAPAINGRGDVAFLATVRRGRESTEALLLSARGQLQKIVAQGDPAPAGGVFAGFGPPAINREGVVAFGAAVEGKAVPGGIFVWKAGQLRMVLGAGDETPIGGIIAKFSERLGLSDTGAIAFHGLLKAAPVSAAVFALEDGRLRVIAQLGDPAPGGGRFSNFGLWPAVSASGVIAFAASVDDGPSPVIVVRTGTDGLRRVVGVGDSVPGGARIASLTLLPVVSVNAGGAVSFAAAPTATGEGPEGVFLATSEP